MTAIEARHYEDPFQYFGGESRGNDRSGQQMPKRTRALLFGMLLLVGVVGCVIFGFNMPWSTTDIGIQSEFHVAVTSYYRPLVLQHAYANGSTVYAVSNNDYVVPYVVNYYSSSGVIPFGAPTYTPGAYQSVGPHP